MCPPNWGQSISTFIREGDQATSTESVLDEIEDVAGTPTRVVVSGNGERSNWSSDAQGVRLHRVFEPNYEPGIDRTSLFSPPEVRMTEQFSLGKPIWSPTTQLSDLSDGRTHVLQDEYTSIALGVESVTVPYGSFDALIFLLVGRGPVFVDGALDHWEHVAELTWRAPGLGVVREKAGGYVVRNGALGRDPIETWLLESTNRTLVPEPPRGSLAIVVAAVLAALRAAHKRTV